MRALRGRTLHRHTLAVLFLLFLLSLPGANAQELQESKPKSPSVGVAIALANTVVPIAIGQPILWQEANLTGALLVSYGLIIGPLPGNLYAKDGRRGWLGVVARTGISLTSGLLCWALVSEGEEDVSAAWPLFLGGAASLAVAARNTWTIPSAVRRYNESLSVSPTMEPDGRFGLRLGILW